VDVLCGIGVVLCLVCWVCRFILRYSYFLVCVGCLWCFVSCVCLFVVFFCGVWAVGVFCVCYRVMACGGVGWGCGWMCVCVSLVCVVFVCGVVAP